MTEMDLRALAQQTAEELASQVMDDEFDATGQHGGDYSSWFAEKIEAALQTAVAQSQPANSDETFKVGCNNCGALTVDGVEIRPHATDCGTKVSAPPILFRGLRGAATREDAGTDAVAQSTANFKAGLEGIGIESLL